MTAPAKHPYGIYHGRSCDTEPCRQALPEEEAIVLLLHDLSDACQALYDAHGRSCDCDFCDDVEPIDYLAEMFRGVLDCQLVPGDATRERSRNRRGEPVGAEAAPRRNPFYHPDRGPQPAA